MQSLQGKHILIVGHKGRMGKYFMRKLAPFSKFGVEVRGIDLPLEDIAQSCADIDLALLCVPAKALASVLQKICPHLPTDCILTDITSVKVRALEHMQKHWQGPIVGTHPLFGPKPPKGTELRVAIVPIEDTLEQHVIFVEHLFQELNCTTFRCTAKKHDKAMAAIQNLNFITSLAYFATLSHDEDLLPFLTPSFKRRQDAAQKLLTEDAELFGGLYDANPYSHEYARKYRSFFNVAAGGDIDVLGKRAAWWWE